MEHDTQDTIAAIATPSGRGGVAIVRISGSLSVPIAQAITGIIPKPRQAHFCSFKNTQGDIIDQGIALYFAGPASFTGEDVLELHGHGGRVVMDLLLQATLEKGARLARPGEFSERAFLNDKIDLAQAEAIADLIDSDSQQAARSALRSLQGEFSSRIQALVQDLISIRSYIEAAIDFVDEDIDFLSDGQVVRRIHDLQSIIAEVVAVAGQGVLLRDGMTLVIAGPPNAGKSSLLNYLAGSDRAIVTELAGTTRDVLREQIVIDGLPLHIIDTAGLRDSNDPIEQIGIERALKEIEQADILLLVFDDQFFNSQILTSILVRVPTSVPLLIVRNKIDLSGNQAAVVQRERFHEITVSIKSGEGTDLLKSQLLKQAGYHPGNESGFLARRRHVDALNRAAGYLDKGVKQLQSHHACELVAEDLRLAQNALAEITGEFSSDDLLGQIFSSFCIGK
jgi:tRNA modification GTPase